MDYKIIGQAMPLVTLTLNKGEIVKSQPGAMKWMDDSVEMELETGQTIKVETGAVGMYEESVEMNIERVRGVKNMLLGGEGLFLTTLSGPGKVWLQTMSIQSMAGEVSPYLNIDNK